MTALRKMARRIHDADDVTVFGTMLLVIGTFPILAWLITGIFLFGLSGAPR